MAEAKVEQRYGPTAGTVTGTIGLVGCAVLAGWLPFVRHDVVADRWALGAGAAAVVLWCFMLRPRIIVGTETLVLRNPLSSWLVPLVVIEFVQVRVVTRIVTASGGRYDAVAVGRPIRSLTGRNRIKSVGGFAGFGGLGGFRTISSPEPIKTGPRFGKADTPDAIADLMIDQVLAAVQRAKEAGHPTGPVRRAWAVPELVLAGAMLLALALTWLF